MGPPRRQACPIRWHSRVTKPSHLSYNWAAYFPLLCPQFIVQAPHFFCVKRSVNLNNIQAKKIICYTVQSFFICLFAKVSTSTDHHFGAILAVRLDRSTPIFTTVYLRTIDAGVSLPVSVKLQCVCYILHNLHTENTLKPFSYGWEEEINTLWNQAAVPHHPCCPQRPYSQLYCATIKEMLYLFLGT